MPASATIGPSTIASRTGSVKEGSAFKTLEVEGISGLLTGGHITGDAMLKHFAQLVRGTLRKIDTAGRMGGEEFAILLPRTDVSAAKGVAERLRGVLTKGPLLHEGKAISMTVSIGVASMDDPSDANADDTLSRADKAASDERGLAILADMIGENDFDLFPIRQDQRGFARRSLLRAHCTQGFSRKQPHRVRFLRESEHKHPAIRVRRGRSQQSHCMRNAQHGDGKPHHSHSISWKRPSHAELDRRASRLSL